MFIDSHCHLDFPELSERLPEILATMQANRVERALCISVNLRDFPRVLKLAEDYPHLYATVGVHPDYEDEDEPTVQQLVSLANHPKVIGIGETGLDYYRLTGDLEWQRQRFRTHIEASRITKKPLIIHTRDASKDTLSIMRECGVSIEAGGAGGVLHCFTETMEVALAAIELGFYISFSGIVTFKNAKPLQEVAKALPLERILIETDSPYLAPVPHRGKTNEPGWVKHVAEFLADLKQVPLSQVEQQTSANFFRLFGIKGS
jgi:TatD DNase family protein